MLRDRECFIAAVSEMPWSPARYRARTRVRERGRDRESERETHRAALSADGLLVRRAACCHVLFFGLQQLMELEKLDSF
jgi:hypothetical protein